MDETKKISKAKPVVQSSSSSSLKLRQLRPSAAAVENDRYSSSSTEDAKLAAVAISLNIRLKSADMPANLQERALRYARSLLDSAPAGSHRPNPTPLARALKKEFDSCYGPAWHCVVGKSFGSFVTHSTGGFVYFSLDSLSFLLFKTEVSLVTAEPPSIPPSC